MRHRTNNIHHLGVKDREVSEDLLKEHVYCHFMWLFGRKNTFRIYLKESAWENEVELSNLDEDFWEEEIKRAV